MRKATYYDYIAESYDELHMYEQESKIKIINNLIKNNNLVSNSSIVLDLGCGPYYGDFGRYFGCSVYGLDTSIELLKIAAAKNPKNFYPVAGRAEKMPFRDNSFDLVVSVTAIQNFEDIEGSVDEIIRVGKRHFIISILKKTEAGKREKIISLLMKRLSLALKIDEEKDIILFLESKR